MEEGKTVTTNSFVPGFFSESKGSLHEHERESMDTSRKVSR